MKAFGIACIFLGACWGMGIALRERRRRRRVLSDFRTAFARMAAEVRFARAPVPDLLDARAETCGPDAASFFRTVAATARRGGTPSERWREAADTLPLSTLERQTVRELAPVFRGDEEQIRKELQAASVRLEESLRDFDRAAKADTRQSAALIFSAAALLIILLC